MEFVDAFDVDSVGVVVDGGGEFGFGFCGAAEGDGSLGGVLGDVGEFAAGGDFESVDVGFEGGEDVGVGVGFGCVVELEVGWECGADGGDVVVEAGEVVDVGG
nr:hypothetical protein [Dermatophilus congolensis]